MYVLRSVEQYLKDRFTRNQLALLDNKQYTVATQYPFANTIYKIDVVLLADETLLTCAVTLEQPATARESETLQLQKEKENKIKLLKNYLIRLEAHFGIFASSVLPKKWQYYKRSGKREPIEISRVHFENAVLGMQNTAQPMSTRKGTPRCRGEITQAILSPEQRELVDNYIEKLKEQTLAELEAKGNLDDFDRELFDAIQTELNTEDALTAEQALLIDEYEEEIKILTIEDLEADTPLDAADQALLTALKNDTPPTLDEDVAQEEIHEQTTLDTEETESTAKTNAKPSTENDICEIVRKHLQTRIDTNNKTRWELRQEYTVQFGRDRKGRADLVMLLNDTPFVIVECKRQGIVGDGKTQLESYLNATRARLGIFANDTDPDNWIFYDTTIGFDEIPRETFIRKLTEEQQNERDIETEAQERKLQRIDKRANQLVTPKAVTERSNQLIEEAAKKRITENAIQASVNKQLHGNIKKLKADNQILREKVSEKSGCAVYGWIAFFITVFILICLLSGC